MNDARSQRLRDFRSLCLHEAAHAVVGELLGWRVRSARVWRSRLEGEVNFASSCRRPWVDAIVSAAGHAAELASWTDAVPIPSHTDRREVRDALRGCGAVRPTDAEVKGMEQQLAILFLVEPIRAAVERVARTLAPLRRLSRAQIVEAIGVVPLIHRIRWRRLARRLVDQAVTETRIRAQLETLS